MLGKNSFSLTQIFLLARNFFFLGHFAFASQFSFFLFFANEIPKKIFFYFLFDPLCLFFFFFFFVLWRRENPLNSSPAFTIHLFRELRKNITFIWPLKVSFNFFFFWSCQICQIRLVNAQFFWTFLLKENNNNNNNSNNKTIIK